MLATLRLRGQPDPSFSDTRIYQLLNEHNIKAGVDQTAIQKVVVEPSAKEKMESFLQRYSMDHAAIDTTHLSPEEVVHEMLDSLPRELMDRIQERSS